MVMKQSEQLATPELEQQVNELLHDQAFIALVGLAIDPHHDVIQKSESELAILRLLDDANGGIVGTTTSSPDVFYFKYARRMDAPNGELALDRPTRREDNPIWQADVRIYTPESGTGKFNPRKIATHQVVTIMPERVYLDADVQQRTETALGIGMDLYSDGSVELFVAKGVGPKDYDKVETILTFGSPEAIEPLLEKLSLIRAS